MRQFTYPMKLTPDKRDGEYVVTCRDFTEAVTQGESIEDAPLEAADCLEEAIATRIDDGNPIPAPSASSTDESTFQTPPSTDTSRCAPVSSITARRRRTWRQSCPR